jgi:CheY-like chemotaxis protein
MVQRRAVILCVDDEEKPLVLRKLVLQKAGYEVVTASSAKEALDVADARKFDLVLSDHLMPGMSGVELTQRIKARYPHLPVILLSGVNEIPAGADSADAFLTKVEGPDNLCREVAAILSHSAARKENSGYSEDSH